jgi:hypothetical protein
MRLKSEEQSLRASQQPGASLRALCFDVGFSGFAGVGAGINLGGGAGYEFGFCISLDSAGFYATLNDYTAGTEVLGGGVTPGPYAQVYMGGSIQPGVSPPKTTVGFDSSVDLGVASFDFTQDEQGYADSMGVGFGLQAGTYNARMTSTTQSWAISLPFSRWFGLNDSSDPFNNGVPNYYPSPSPSDDSSFGDPGTGGLP